MTPHGKDSDGGLPTALLHNLTRNKRRAFLLLSSLLNLAALIPAIAAKCSSPTSTFGADAILHNSCAGTRYPALCRSAISSSPSLLASISSHTDVILASLNLTHSAVHRSILHSTHMPTRFWGEAVRHAVYLLNRLPTKALGERTPFEAWMGRKPHLAHLKVFGCIAYAKNTTPQLKKLDDRSSPMVYLGVEEGCKAHRLFDPRHNKLQVSRDVIFQENSEWTWNAGADKEDLPEFVVVNAFNTDEVIVTADIEAAAEDVTPSSSLATPSSTRASSPSTPSSSTQATTSPESHEGPVRYRSINIADIYANTEEIIGIDEEENEVMLMMSEEPTCYQEAATEACWSLRELGFKKCNQEHAVYTRGKREASILVGVYVDDLIVTGRSTEGINKFKQQMMTEFEMSDLGLLSYYLGIEVEQQKSRILLRQSAYAKKILSQFQMADCNATKQPMEPKTQLHKDLEGTPIDATEYRRVIGCLRYLLHTRPDLSYSVGMVSRYMEKPTSMHHKVVKQILRYLKVLRVVFFFFPFPASFAIHRFCANTNLTPRDRTALGDCLDMFDDSLDDLRDAATHLRYLAVAAAPSASSSSNIPDSLLVDLEILVSAAMTNQESCLDGFSHSQNNRRLRQSLVAELTHVTHMCSNALRMIKNLSVNGGGWRRRTMGRNREAWPEWMRKADRRRMESEEVAADAVVAGDGSRDYRTVQEAVIAAPEKSKRRHVIRIKAGTYVENVEVPKKKKNLMFVGDGRKTTVITGNRNVKDGCTTFRSATLAVVGNGFLALGLRIENTAGPSKDQAVALRVVADLSAFYDCDIVGHQDTPDPGQKNMITASGRNDPDFPTGIIIHHSRIAAAPDLAPVAASFKTYLCRPWKMYSRTVVLESEISDVIEVEGWHEWNGSFALDTLYFGEFRNTGPGAVTGGRVKWQGHRVISNVSEAEEFTPGNFIAGADWLKATGFPFSLGLSTNQ
ncbi:hypothetical protein ZIOFF_008313 [Zingiber officinale]|uniref:pectinesterase n=1 Tax=Zingiber officinale TaxID=94328 RepID=A0A8J5HS80_ZINOF|nr:hypothetical protein ZIOFF_008313 [Zingiber officinale]